VTTADLRKYAWAGLAARPELLGVYRGLFRELIARLEKPFGYGPRPGLEQIVARYSAWVGEH
jgi:hypothetical protein